MEDSLRLVIIAGDPMVRAVLAAQLAGWPGVEVVGQTGMRADDATELAAAFGPVDGIIWDWGWESTDVAERPGDPLPLVALVADAEDAAEARALGVKAILTRDPSPERMIAAMHALAAGLVVVATEYATVLASAAPAAGEPVEELTAREQDVLALLAEGLTNKAIARRLAISDHTVKFHVNAIMGKLGAQSRTEAVVRATRLGLLSL